MTKEQNYTKKSDTSGSCSSRSALDVQRHMFTRLSECLKEQKSVMRRLGKYIAVIFTSLVTTAVLPILLAKCGRKHRGILSVLTAVSAAIALVSAGEAVRGVRNSLSLGRDIKWLEEEIEYLEN